MPFITQFVALCESDTFFQSSLLLLLGSILISFRTNTTRLFFAASGACLLTATSTMVYEVSRAWTGRSISVEMMASTILSGMLCATFTASVAARMRAFVVNMHTAATLGLCVCLGVGACRVWMEMATDGNLELETGKIRAAIFCNMHLVASILAIAESACGESQPATRSMDRRPKIAVISDNQVCAMV